MSATKRCTRCAEVKLTTEFFRDADRPDYTTDIDTAERIARRAIRGDDGDWEADEVLATAATSMAMSLVTLTRQLADFGPALASQLLDVIASSVQSIDTQIGGRV